jgi:hypothetical protein
VQKKKFLESFNSLLSALRRIKEEGGVIDNLTYEADAQLSDELNEGYTQCVLEVSIFPKSSPFRSSARSLYKSLLVTILDTVPVFN